MASEHENSMSYKGDINVDIKINSNEMIRCPIDKNHRLLPHRLPIHLIRCTRNHPGNDFVRCPFNITHVLLVSQLKDHVVNCENRADFEHFATPSVLPREQHFPSDLPTADCEENWDDEPHVGTYDPSEYCRKNLIVRCLRGASASERRLFREAERKKFAENS